MELPLFGTVYGKKIPLTIMEILTLVVLVFLIVRTVWRYCREKKNEDKADGKASIWRMMICVFLYWKLEKEKVDK